MSNETNAYNRKVAIAAVAEHYEGFDGKGVSKDELLWLMGFIEGMAAGSKSMAATLRKYRAGYEPTVSHTGRKSLHNGDVVAAFLAGRSPDEAMSAAERILGLDAGFLTEKYASLNDGAKRMNSGNRIRAALKRKDITEAALTH